MSEREKKADLFRELTLDVYRRVAEANNAVDSKIQNMLTLAIALIPLILGVFYYVTRNGVRTLSPFPPMVFISLGAGVVCFVLAVMIGAWTYKPIGFSALSAANFVKKHKNANLVEIKEIAVATLGDIVEDNWKIVNRKGNGYKRMLWFFTLGTLAFSIGFMLLLTTALN